MIYLVGGAAINPGWLAEQDSESVEWIGVDSGTKSIIEAGLLPARAFGDFDSVTDEEFQKIKRSVPNVIVVKPEKDETDMELALKWALTQGKTLRLYGVTGGRLDHFFGNVQLLLSENVLNSDTTVEIVDQQNILRCMLPGETIIPRNEQYPYLSIIPMSPKVEGLTLEGVKYPVDKIDIKIGNTLTISNEITKEKASISFRAGIVIIIRSRDS